jgi:uncharacterized protein (UPF0548 family)
MRFDAARRLAALAPADLTYAERGATRDAALPGGYRHVDRDDSIGSGRATFERAVDGLLGWGMHRGAGLAVAASAERASPGVLVILRAGWAPLSLVIPCRVVYSVDTTDRQGFAYGTLPGHPERGEEAFTVQLTPDGDVRMRIRAFSRPARVLARAGGPFTRLVQDYVTNRYVHALRRLANRSDGTPTD